MKRILSGLAAATALGALAYAGPARACGAQQKTTTTAKADEEKAQPQKTSGAKQQAPKDAKAKQQQQTNGAQAKAEAATARPEQR